MPNPVSCAHPDGALTVTGAGNSRWTAQCGECGHRMSSHLPDGSTDPSVPAHVRTAAGIALGVKRAATPAEVDSAYLENRVRHLGTPYSSRTGWEEGCQWHHYDTDKHPLELLVTSEMPEVALDRLWEPGSARTHPRLHQFLHAPVDFGLIIGRHIVCTVTRWRPMPLIGAPEWIEEGFTQQSISLQMGDAPLPGEGPVPDGQHRMVILMLVEATSGLIVGLREITWPGNAVNALREALDGQRLPDGTYDPEAARREARRWQDRWPVERLLDNAHLTWRGGADDPALDRR